MYRDFSRLILCACALTMVFAIGSNIAKGEMSDASKPTPSTSWDSITNTVLYRTDFNHINDFTEAHGDGGSIGINNGHLEIDSPTEDSYSICLSRHVDDYVIDLRSEFDFPVYSAETVFDSDDSDYDGHFYVLYNSHIKIIATDHFNRNSLAILSNNYQIPGNPTEHYYELVDLTNPPSEHKIYVEVYGYQSGVSYMYCRIFIDGIMKIEDFPTEDNYQLSPMFRFGDTYTDAWYGSGLWDYLEVRGFSSAKYFENFNDNNMHDWSNFFASEDATWRVSNGQLLIDSTWQGFIPIQRDGWAETQYIDYNPNDVWTVSLDFYLLPIVMESTYSYLAHNGQFSVYVKADSLYYEDNLGEHFVMNLQTSRWYFLEIVRVGAGASQYNIMIDRVPRATNCAFYSTTAIHPFIRIGDDFDWQFAKINIDNLKMEIQGDTSVDTDDDLLSDAFETGVFNQQTCEKIILWYDDFESSLDFEEAGWDDSMSRPTTDSGLGNNHKWEVGRPTVNYFGVQAGDPKHGWMDVSTSLYEPDRGGVLATAIDNDYGVANVIDYVTTPPVDMTNVETARLVFWHWYHFEAGDDGGRILISINGGAYALLGSYPSFYNYNNVGALSGAGFSGNSNGWVRTEIGLPPAAQGNIIKLRILYATDNDNNNYPGWYIDSVRIYGTSDEEDSNIDADYSESWIQGLLGGANGKQYLLDGEEYYYFGSSPFLRDTDGDCLYDNMEVFHTDFNNDGLASGRADVLTKDIYIEVDYMDGFKPATSDYSSAVDAFDDHDIVLHIVIDDELVHASPISTSTALAYYSTYMTIERRKIFYYCLVADDCTTQCYGVTDTGGISSRFALFHGAIDNHIVNFNSVLMHELGHDMGQRHYDWDWTWDTQKPDYAAMKTGSCNNPDYMNENSDTLYAYKVQVGDPWKYDRFGGWEYACTVSGYSNPQFGLCFKGVLRTTF